MSSDGCCNAIVTSVDVWRSAGVTLSLVLDTETRRAQHNALIVAATLRKLTLAITDASPHRAEPWTSSAPRLSTSRNITRTCNYSTQWIRYVTLLLGMIISYTVVSCYVLYKNIVALFLLFYLVLMDIRITRQQVDHGRYGTKVGGILVVRLLPTGNPIPGCGCAGGSRRKLDKRAHPLPPPAPQNLAPRALAARFRPPPPGLLSSLSPAKIAANRSVYAVHSVWPPSIHKKARRGR